MYYIGRAIYEEEFAGLLADKGTSCYAVSVSDKYGDYGSSLSIELKKTSLFHKND